MCFNIKVWIENNFKISIKKELTFSNFLSPYARMLPFGNMKPFDNKEIFLIMDYTFDVFTMRQIWIY